MIGKLSGTIDSVIGSQVILDVNGVGYVVSCSARTLRQLGANGMGATLRVETQVREDAISLFGFIDTLEQDWFRLLTTVQGVGAKVALSIMGAVSPEQLAQVIAAQDKKALTQADGVGPKLALRIVTELKDKVPAFTGHAATSLKAVTGLEPGSVPSDAVSALINLGYKRAEAFGAVAAVNHTHPDVRLDEMLRLALVEMSRKDHAA